jgi:hypothetical protein
MVVGTSAARWPTGCLVGGRCGETLQRSAGGRTPRRFAAGAAVVCPRAERDREVGQVGVLVAQQVLYQLGRHLEFGVGHAATVADHCPVRG